MDFGLSEKASSEYTCDMATCQVVVIFFIIIIETNGRQFYDLIMKDYYTNRKKQI